MELRELRIDVPWGSQAPIPCSIWSASDNPRGVVLVGHGLGVDRYDITVRRPVDLLTMDHDAVVVVPEIPLHGVRDAFADDPLGIVDRWQEFWVSGGADVMAKEFLRVTERCRELYGALPIAYFGVSLGTQYGVAFLAQSSDVQAAVLGLFGSHPAPKTPVMNRFAPRVRCPVYFIQKLDDEIHSAASTTHLFASLGCEHKVLDSTRGRHTDTSLATLRNSCAFLARVFRTK